MDDIQALLKPSWGAEQWIMEGWDRISDEDRASIRKRIEPLFQDGLPFELIHPKIVYIYAFSLLAQLEVLAIQIPLKFVQSMPEEHLKERLHQQLLDEIFHGMVFTKIVYILSSPQAVPPEYNANIELLCNYIRNEKCPKTALALLNLIGEAWIEEMFKAFKPIAPELFELIMQDEERHLADADWYKSIGLPDKSAIQNKIAFVEEQLLNNIFLQYKYVFSVIRLITMPAAIQFVQSLNQKHQQQLVKIGLEPSVTWSNFMGLIQEIFAGMQLFTAGHSEIALSPTRKLFMTQWSNPSDPTMAGEFDINVDCIGFFEKKYPPELLTTLMMQTISYTLEKHDSFRLYLSLGKLYQYPEALVAITVKLPDCGDQIGIIYFKNCHRLSVRQLSTRVRTILHTMVYCYKRREELEKIHPHLSEKMTEFLDDFNHPHFPSPMPGLPGVFLSNIGSCGYSQAKSPLRSNEVLKFTLLEVQRKMVWDKQKASFIAQDCLPVSISADHRIFDGNLPIPKIIAANFKEIFNKLPRGFEKPSRIIGADKKQIMMLEKLVAANLELGYRTLAALHTTWVDSIDD